MASKKQPLPIPPLPAVLGAGVCNTWECDHWGHMNVRFYVARAHQAWGLFAASINLADAFQREAVSTLLPRELHIRFHREVRGGEYMMMTGGVVEIGESDVTVYHELRKPNAGDELAATFRVVLDHVDAKSGRPFAWTRKSLEPLQRYRIDGIPAHGAARSIDLSKAPEPGNLARANELGMPLVGLSILQPQETDALGRMHPSLILGRQADSFPGMWRAFFSEAAAALEEADRAPALSSALIETRLIFRRWPKVGSILQTQGGLTCAEGKLFGFKLWTIDPVSGECWMENENFAVHFDTQARCAYEPPEKVMALFKKHVLKI